MALFRRSPQLPGDVRERLGLSHHQPTLAIGRLTDGWAVATSTRLHAVVGDDVVVRDWSDVDGARLDTEGATLTVTWVDGTRPTVMHIADDRAVGLPRVVHDRVQSSVVHTERVVVPNGATVRVAVRRSADGHLLTQVIGTGDVDLSDPATASLVEAAEARVAEATGQ
ncbi:MAG: hypothetical protein HGA44_03265 [Cellulomonadaceae bacterium]|nr:hypothetical protein [Cellulomonadaceae bacterium]